ncbi:MAG: DUF1501 domain-containing protein [Deltaproteobacteria bacterium]|nr:DUF1501 domain-containing protein [Deltaproteobacteria bacterium]
MAISRRKFLTRGALTAAALGAPHPFQRALLGASTAWAGPAGAIVVLVQMEGGNDGLNTVIPIDDKPGHAQRSLYDAARPSIGIPVANLLATEIDPDPVKGNRLGLHPSLAPLHDVYAAGKVAVLNGIAYPNQNLSHFRSEDIWFSANPTGAFVDGWFGRYLDSAFTSSDLVTVDFDNTLNPTFLSSDSNVLAVGSLAEFELTDDPQYPDLAAKVDALTAAYAVEADPLETSGTHNAVGISGNVLLGALDAYQAIDTSWPSNLNGKPGRLARRLKDVSSILRNDAITGTPVGARFFHVRQGGYDTHSNQGSLTGRQADLFTELATDLKAFYDDTVDLGIANKVLVLTFSEFGRRVAQNGGNGTDHGEASVLFAMGDAVVGGVYGAVPALNDLNKGNLKVHTDFRQVYATVIDKWLATPGTHAPLLPGGPFTTLPFLT